MTTPISRFLGLCLGGAAIAQAVAAILFYFAGNWWGMAPATKIGLIDMMLLVCAAAAVLTAPASFGRSAWASAGAVLSGVLFGVHGQIWQSGADAWELFALWTVLAALWAGLARSDAAWAITAVLGMTGLWLWGDNAAPWDVLPYGWHNSLLALSPLVVAVVSYFAGGRASWLLPVLLTLGAIALGMGGVQDLDGTWGTLLLGLVVAVATMALAPPRRFGPWPFAIAMILAVVLVEGYCIHEFSDDAGGLLFVGALLLAGVGGIAVALRRLFASQLGGITARNELVLSIVVGSGAWIAVGTSSLALGLVINFTDGDRHLGMSIAVCSGVLALALRLFWPNAKTFGIQVQAAFATVAYGAVLAHLGLNDASWDMVAAAAGLLLVALLAGTRSAAAGAVGMVVTLSLVGYRAYDFDPLALLVLSVALTPLGWFGLGWGKPSIKGGALVLVLAAFALPGWLEFDNNSLPVAFDRGAAVLSAFILMGLTLWTRRDLAQPRLLGAGALVLAGSLAVPAGGAALVGLTAVSVRAMGRLLVLLGFAAAGWSVVRYYYLMAVPLVDKAGLLAVGAVLTAAAWALLGGRPQLNLRPAATSALLLAGALVPAAIQAWDGAGKVRIVAEGQQVLLPLRPSDPRSLIQGDYMTLRYSRDLMEKLPARGGMVALRLDGEVAVSARPVDGPLAANEILVRARPGRDAPRLAPDSFLFEEGTGDEWGRARFAIVRVKNGALVMTGLADVMRQPIVVQPRQFGVPTPVPPPEPAAAAEPQ
jgi:uncharacterized membrane-anchored protein